MGCGSSSLANTASAVGALAIADRQPSTAEEKVTKEARRTRAREVSVRDVYSLGKTLGQGGFAVVRLATHRETQQKYAVKIMNLPNKKDSEAEKGTKREDIFKEIEILMTVKHPNVISIVEYFEESKKVCTCVLKHIVPANLIHALGAKVDLMSSNLKHM